MDTKKLQDLLEEKVSRRQFLSYIGAAILAITGITALVKNLSSTHRTSNTYGGGVYGGKKKIG